MCEMTTFVYIHGFNSAYSRENPKVATLEKLGNVEGITYETVATFAEAAEELETKARQIIEATDGKVVFVGTSLGGFFAAYLGAKFFLPSVSINPAVEPGLTLQKYVGIAHTNYVTGHTKTFTQQMADSYAGKTLALYGLYRPLVLVDLADEVIPALKTLTFVANLAPAYAYDGGNHRFEHMEEALEQIKIYLNQIETTTHF